MLVVFPELSITHPQSRHLRRVVFLPSINSIKNLLLTSVSFIGSRQSPPEFICSTSESPAPIVVTSSSELKSDSIRLSEIDDKCLGVFE